MPLTAKEILLKAAELLEEDKRGMGGDGMGYARYGYACVAIDAVTLEEDTLPLAHEAAMSMFRRMYKPADKHVGDSWFGNYREPGGFDVRIAALRNTAAAFN